MERIQEIFNFDNIGQKIKKVAQWSCWISIILLWVAAIIVFIVLASDSWTSELCWIPIVSAIVGPAVVWFGSWYMYAFGELVEDIHAMRNKECPAVENDGKEEKELVQDMDDTQMTSTGNAQMFACPTCGKNICNGDSACDCGQSFDWSKI